VKKVILAVVASVTLVGCAGPVPKKSADLKLGSPPTKEEAMQRISAYLNDTLIDPESAKVVCTHVPTPGWVWPGIGSDLHYGYLSLCDVNAKNRYGGYTGAKRYVFRFNGTEFEHHDVVPKMGLVKDN